MKLLTATCASLLLGAACALAADVPENTWTKVNDDGIGSRFSPGLIYDAVADQFVLVGGAIGRHPKGGPFPYDLLASSPLKGEWRNAFPEGSGWSPEVGPATIPNWKGYRFSSKDAKGNVRPHMRHTQMFNQYCVDTDQRCVWAIISSRTMRLDLKTMKWEDLGVFPAETNMPSVASLAGLMWGSMCYDPVNKEIVLFGGGHKKPQPEGSTWLFSSQTRKWRVLDVPDDKQSELRKELKALQDKTKNLVAALRNRLFHVELPEKASVSLDDAWNGLVPSIQKLAGPLEKAGVLQESEKALLTGLSEISCKAVTAEVVQAVERTAALLRQLAGRVSVHPSPRLMAPMVYVPGSRKIVMFGGDQWDQISNETWVYDCASRRWTLKTPVKNPSPRAGHALLLLPKSGKVLLMGGYRHRTSMSYCTSLYEPIPLEMWSYDLGADSWQLLKQGGAAKPSMSCSGRAPVAPAAAASKDDVVRVIGLGKKLSTWSIRVNPVPDAQGTEKQGREPGAVLQRGLSFNPAWFDDTAATAKPDEVAAKLAALPPNTWIAMSPPKRLFNRDWGTQIFDFDRDQIMHWSGGHSAYCGTAVAHYSVKLDRWSTGVAAEIPMEHCYSAGVAGTSPASTFSGRPFAPHTYKSYCYDPTTKKLVWLHESKAWIYDPDRREWESPKPVPFNAERHTTVACSTPHGIAAWAVPAGKGVYHGWRGMWLMTDTANNTWKTLIKPDKKSIFPTAYGDRHGMCYDSKRDRLYLFHFGLKRKHKIAVYDFKSATSEVIEPKGGKGFPSAASVGREPVYVPEQDVVFIASRAKKGPVTLLFDPAANAWLQMEPGHNKNQKGHAVRPAHGVSTGVMWDPGRKCLWASDARGPIYVMKFDRKTADAKPLD